MKHDTLLCARYWRNSLADAELGRGAFRNDEVAAFISVDRDALLRGMLGPDVVAALFQDGDADLESRIVLLRPVVYRARFAHGRRRASLPDVLTPIVSRVSVFRDGLLGIPSTTVVPRDLLEPLDRNALTIGSVAALDGFLTRSPQPDGPSATDAATGTAMPGWQAYRDYCQRLAQAVCPELQGDERFERVASGFIAVQGHAGSSRPIGALYDQMEKDRPAVPLFATVASQCAMEASPCLPPQAAFANRLGHSSPLYALAEAQRSALAHLLVAKHGEVVTVNGPPGTGKTTLLLAVVASLWTKAALDRGDAPIILAASHNNQAVTNIIDAFGADFAAGDGPFAGRWLPDVRSFGSYFPARSRIVGDTYLTQTFFDRTEDADYLQRAQTAFLQAAAIAFPELPEIRVEAVVEALHRRLREQADVLAAIDAAWNALVSARHRARALLGDDPDVVRARLRGDAETAEAWSRRAKELGTAWDRHQSAEPLLQILFGWVPAVGRKRLAGARAALRQYWPDALPDWTRISDIAPAIVKLAEAATTRAAECQAELATADMLLQARRACLDGWRSTLAALKIASGDADRMTLADCDALADRHLRFPMFQTATHYWEGRWLLDMAAIGDPGAEKRRKGRSAVIARWRRRMKLTPCAVSTLFVLPDLMRASRYDNDAFVNDYLYDTIDLLIVDEAGQVTPEIAGAAFALARRALVIGDTAQIQPIWNVPSRVDTGNLRDGGLLARNEAPAERNAFVESGRAASSGSLMRVAQHVSRYHQDPDLARGLALYEHRRCFDEIIGYCNDLCYHGKLKPLRGSKANAVGPGADGLPAMGYLQVDGLCERLPGGSRHNLVEAETIARWIADSKALLQRSYSGWGLERILGVVTPFAAQAQAIRAALGAAGLEAGSGGGVTVGSVHAFQGGQRPVMIFSPTYSKHADGNFLDISPSMLNVAVSRAMNSFLVFGDMDCFSAAPRSSPRGQLGRRLFGSADHALAFGRVPRRDLMRRGQLEHLRDATAHDAFLNTVLACSRREVHVVTPWLTQRALDESGVMPAVSAAVTRGIALVVYTDRELNTQRVAHDRAAHDDLRRAFGTLREAGADLIELSGVHSKVLMADDDLFCVGSFNWFSAARDGEYARHETSLAYRGSAVATEIEAMKASLRQRIVR